MSSLHGDVKINPQSSEALRCVCGHLMYCGATLRNQWRKDGLDSPRGWLRNLSLRWGEKLDHVFAPGTKDSGWIKLYKEDFLINSRKHGGIYWNLKFVYYRMPWTQLKRLLEPQQFHIQLCSVKTLLNRCPRRQKEVNCIFVIVMGRNKYPLTRKCCWPIQAAE